MTLVNILNEIASAVDAAFSKEVMIALIAAWMGARATRKATNEAHWNAIKKSDHDEARITKNTLLLLSVEISTAWDLYQEEYAKDLFEVAASEPYLCNFPIGNNPFPIYDSVPACLANINPDTSAKLVRLYMRMKGMVSMIELNNKNYHDICKATQDAMKIIISKADDKKIEISEAGSEKLSEYYDTYQYQESKKLNMGDTADGMKALTSEIELLVNDIKLDIAQYIRQNH
ncbi:hypothetical protein [Pseudomonas sp. OV546]|uniref:hypothetical protein n=1 Tax=Pseudomonas sp. OV546 TaxID=1881063 RepID=UPI0008EC4AE8|nr:hypothetical protein [Pseudomonas sp. OV546]SFU80823.1 hypothetical protein SAMN05428951_104399 [Pseudomonas sp. OV546]